ncbi:leucine-rich_repeat domain-containing protein [Hexamita inflata]|uniref:Leucine-rich_repeat domain-containing protein n=1 Tax=Hexamita inflata TaxID=28002 RepID=A0ABP1I7P9_9EUKA
MQIRKTISSKLPKVSKEQCDSLEHYMKLKYTEKKLVSMTTLEIQGQKFSNINSIQLYKQITTLNLYNNQIINIEALKDMRQLISLDLSKNKINNIWSLLYLRLLKNIDLESNEVNDILVFYKHKNVVSLNLNYNQVICLDPLLQCTSLENLSVLNNNIIDFEQLCDIKSLDTVDIDGNMLEGVESFVRDYESSESNSDPDEHPYGKKYEEFITKLMEHSTIDYYEDSYDEDNYDEDKFSMDLSALCDDGQVGKFYFGCQGSATKKQHKFNTKLSKITNLCIINLENFMKIQHLKRNYISKMNSVQNLITFKLSSQLNRLNLTMNDFVNAFSVINSVFE